MQTDTVVLIVWMAASVLVALVTLVVMAWRNPRGCPVDQVGGAFMMGVLWPVVVALGVVLLPLLLLWRCVVRVRLKGEVSDAD